jgi:plasmid segregation protein ParM
MREPSVQPGYERRKTVAIPINGLFYEVGPKSNWRQTPCDPDA